MSPFIRDSSFAAKPAMTLLAQNYVMAYLLLSLFLLLGTLGLCLPRFRKKNVSVD